MRTNEELALLAKQGDKQATAQLWAQTEKIITKLATPYFKLGKRLGFDFEDIVQEGFLAMMRAVGYYDPNKELAFTSYLSLCIKSTLLQDMGVPRYQELPPCPRSFDEPIAGEDSLFSLADVIPDADAESKMEQTENNIYLAQLRKVLRPIWDKLDESGREYLTARFGAGETFAEIGKRYGVSRQTAMNRERKYLGPFQKPELLRQLKTFLFV